MSQLLLDQAAGLRKLLNQNPLRTIAIASAATQAGRTTVAANLAVALAQKGVDVLLLDAASGPGSAGWLLNAEPKADLAAGWNNRADVKGLVAEGHAGVRVIRAQGARAALRQLSLERSADLAHIFHTLHQSAAVVLIDAPAGDLSLTAAAREIVLVAGPQLAAITETYRLLKRLHGCGPERLHVLVNRAPGSPHGNMIFDNLSSTSRRFLNLPLELIGQVPEDASLLRATQLRKPVVEALANAPSARALRAAADALMCVAYPGDDGFKPFAHRLLASARTFGSSN